MSDFGFGFGGGGGLDPFGIDTWLIAELGAILSALEFIWAALVAAANWLLNAVIALAKFIAAHIEIAAKFLAKHLEDLYDKLISPILKELRKIYDWLQKEFAAIQQIINKIQKWYNTYILPWQKRMEQIISALRVSISLFKALGFKWAAKLDAEFAKVQSYITLSIIDVVRTLNTLTTWIQFATDPLGLVRRGFWQTTVFSNMKDVLKIGHLGGMAGATGAQKTAMTQNQQLMDPKVPTVTLGPSNQAIFSPAMQSVSDGLLASAKYYNPTVPGYVGPESP